MLSTVPSLSRASVQNPLLPVAVWISLEQGLEQTFGIWKMSTLCFGSLDRVPKQGVIGSCPKVSARDSRRLLKWIYKAFSATEDAGKRGSKERNHADKWSDRVSSEIQTIAFEISVHIFLSCRSTPPSFPLCKERPCNWLAVLYFFWETLCLLLHQAQRKPSVRW